MTPHDQRPPRLRRSVLSVPADNPRALAKTAVLDMDAVIYDLEDSVAPERKADARKALLDHLGTEPKPHFARIVRINALSGPDGEADLAAFGRMPIDAILLPKVESPADVQSAADALADLDEAYDTRLWAMIETPRGIVNCTAIAETGRTRGGRLDCLVLGLNDLRAATGVAPLPGRTYLIPWLMQVLLAARGSGLDVLDSVFNDIRDGQGFEDECRQGSDMGFDGKMLIHPDQIAPANRHFGVDPEQLRQARDIVAAFALPENARKGVLSYEGRMVERLHLAEAHRLIARAVAQRCETAAS